MESRRRRSGVVAAVSLIIPAAFADPAHGASTEVAGTSGTCAEVARSVVRDARTVVHAPGEPFSIEYIPDRPGPLIVTVFRRAVDAEIGAPRDGIFRTLQSPAAIDGQDTFVVEGRAGEPVRLVATPLEVTGPGSSLAFRIERVDGEPRVSLTYLAALRLIANAYELHAIQAKREADASAATLQALAQLRSDSGNNSAQTPALVAIPAQWEAVDVALSNAADAVRPCLGSASGNWQRLNAEVSLARAALATLKLENWETALDLARASELRSDELDLRDAAVRSRVFQASALIDGAAEAKRSNNASRQREVTQSFDKAVALLTTARDHYRRTGRIADEAYVENYFGAANHYTGAWDAASRHYEVASRLYARTAPSFRNAVLTQNMALLASERGDYAEAARLYDRAKQLIRAFPRPEMLATVLENEAFTLSILGRQDEAITGFSAALGIRRAQANEAGVVRSMLGIGLGLMRAGEIERATPFIEEAWAIRSQHSDRDPRGWIATGFERAELQRLRGALSTAAETLDSIERVATTASQKARLAIQRAKTMLDRGDYAQALGQYDFILTLGLPSISSNVMLARVGRLRALVELGEVEAARRELATQREPSRIFPGSLHAIDAMFLAAELEARVGTRTRAIARVDEAIAATRAVRSSSLSAEARARFMASRREQEELKICLLAGCSALRGAAAGALRSPAGDTVASSQEAAIASLLASESARTSAFAELVATASDRRTLGSRTEVARGTLLSDIESKLARLDGLSDRPVGNAREIAALHQSILDAEMRLRRLEPPSSSAPATDMRTLRARLDHLVAHLPERTVALEFFVGRKSAWVWTIGRGRVAVHEIASGPASVAALRADVRALQDVSHASADMADRLATLSHVLVEPYVDLASTGRLIVIPDRELFFVPFPALVVHTGDGASRPLVESAETMLAPSLSRLEIEPHRLPLEAAIAKVAIIADPVFNDDDPRVPQERMLRVANTRSSASSENLARLPGTVAEADALRALVPLERTTLLSGTSATREAVLRALAPGVGIAHFATHSVVRPSDTQLSFLALSAYDSEWRPVPSRLYGADILSAGIRADLVVLSACRSAVGEVVAGEGPMGLSHSFLANGSKAVVAALWPVPDRFAAEFMRDFYTALLREKLPPAGALRAAQLRARQSLLWNNPYYWAAFSLTTAVSP